MEFNSIPEGMHVILELLHVSRGFSGGAVAKNLPANAGDTEDMGSIPGSGRAPEEGMATYFSILTWRIPWTEEPDGLQSIGSQRIRQY